MPVRLSDIETPKKISFTGVGGTLGIPCEWFVDALEIPQHRCPSADTLGPRMARLASRSNGFWKFWNHPSTAVPPQTPLAH